MEYLIVFILCGIAAGIIAANKGRSVAGWAFLGVLFGPIGVLLALVVAKNQAAIDQRAIAAGESRKCPMCAEVVKREAVVCKHCGSPLSAIEQTPPPAHEKPLTYMEARARSAAICRY